VVDKAAIAAKVADKIEDAATAAKIASEIKEATSAAKGGAGELTTGSKLSIGPWGEGVTNVKPGATFIQCGDGSCVSATGQILTGGKVTESQLIGQLGEWADVSKLPGTLSEMLPGTKWEGHYFGSGDEALAIAQKGQFGAVLQAPTYGAHMVTIEPLKSGKFLVTDTGVGATYIVTSEWIKKYVSAGVWKK
jgi:hypothetical protein